MRVPEAAEDLRVCAFGVGFLVRDEDGLGASSIFGSGSRSGMISFVESAAVRLIAGVGRTTLVSFWLSSGTDERGPRSSV